MSLFNLGDFTLHGGSKSKWKIDCDALTDDDINTLAHIIHKLVGPFRTVEGIPTGGLRLAKALEPLAGSVGGLGRNIHLIVDDVLTTGGSMERARQKHMGQGPAGRPGVMGAVIFARGKSPYWIRSVFNLNPIIYD